MNRVFIAIGFDIGALDRSDSRILVDAPESLWSNTCMRKGRVLAVDYGSRNVGLATSDELGIAVRPLPSIPNRSRRDLLQRLKAASREYAAECLVVGLPLNMDGSLGEAAHKVQRFIEQLRREAHLPLREVDERLSTVEAEEVWRAMNARQRRKYRTVDSLAAAFILERFLRES